MITVAGSREIISRIVDAVTIKEDVASHTKRIEEEKSYHLRRYEMAAGVTKEYRSPETLTFESDTRDAVENFDPSQVASKSWIGIGNFRIFLVPPRRPQS